MLTREKVLDDAARIEQRLVERHGASGLGLHEKLTSVESQLDHHILRKIRLIASIRNKAAHGAFSNVNMPEWDWDRLVNEVLDSIGRFNPFMFKGMPCSDSVQLRQQMQSDPTHAAWQLYEGNVERWFAYIGNAADAALAQQIRLQVRDQTQGVEAFIRGTCKLPDASQSSAVHSHAGKSRTLLGRIRDVFSR